MIPFCFDTSHQCPFLVCLQRAPPSWSLKRAVRTISECSTTGSCWTRCRWMPTPTAASSTLRSRWTPTYLHMPPRVYEVRRVVILPCYGKVSWRQYRLSQNVLVIRALFIRALYFCAVFLLCFCVTAQIGNTQTELKKLAEQNPELKDAYVAKQRRLKVSKDVSMPNVTYTEDWGSNPPKATLPWKAKTQQLTHILLEALCFLLALDSG